MVERHPVGGKRKGAWEYSLFNLISFKLGDKTNIDFFKSKWIGEEPLAKQFLELYATLLYPNVKVSDCVHCREGSWEWSLQDVESEVVGVNIVAEEEEYLITILKDIQPSKDEHDEFIWICCPMKNFSM